MKASQNKNSYQDKVSPFFDLKRDKNNNKYLEVYSKGYEVLRLAALNKGTAFTLEERIDLGLEGLLPPEIISLTAQVVRLYEVYCKEQEDIDKYQFLRAVQDRNEVLFYGLVSTYLEEMMPIIYTPTVGKAVQLFSSLYRSPRGLTFTEKNIERVNDIVNNYPWNDVQMIVATDSSAILGIGDQGHGGLAISIGKLSLYTAGGGLSPFNTLAVNLDVGTTRKDLWNDLNYLGVKEERLTGDAYYAVLDKFVDAVKKRWPRAIIQWEDFAKDVAFKVLERYRDTVSSFNDDIQGTGAVVLAGLLSACKLKGESLADQRIMVVGAGAGGVGVAKVIQDGLVKEGLTRDQARSKMYIMDEFGLVVDGISPDEYKKPIMQSQSHYSDWKIEGEIPTVMEVMKNAKPTILLGLTGVPGLFTQEMIEKMADNNEQPIICPLSNPTSNIEALPQDIYEWTKGTAIIASGSPFPPVTFEEKTSAVGQGNNAFIFPGLGFASVLGNCPKITDEMIIESAYALAEYTEKHNLSDGLIFPPISSLRDVSKDITHRVLKLIIEDGLGSDINFGVDDIDKIIEDAAWKPEYLPMVSANNI